MVATGKNFLREKKRTSAHGTCIVARPPLQQGGTRKRNTKYRITCCGIPGPFTEDSRVHAIAVYLFRIYQNAYVHTPFESPAANRAAQHQSHRHSWIVSIRESDSGSMGTHRPPCINTGDTLGQTTKGPSSVPPRPASHATNYPLLSAIPRHDRRQCFCSFISLARSQSEAEVGDLWSYCIDQPSREAANVSFESLVQPPQNLHPV